MMRLAIMQPYFFPYIGYFQLVASVDRFLFLDDANYIKQGWINRNRLEVAGCPTYVTIPVLAASSHKRINEIAVPAMDRWRRKLLRMITESYKGAPHLDAAVALVEAATLDQKHGIAGVARRSVELTAAYLGLDVDFNTTSSSHPRADFGGKERVLEICLREGAQDYYNLPGGSTLYQEAEFARVGIALHFVAPRLDPYPRSGRPFRPALSILDALMFNESGFVARMIHGKGVS